MPDAVVRRRRGPHLNNIFAPLLPVSSDKGEQSSAPRKRHAGRCFEFEIGLADHQLQTLLRALWSKTV